MFDTQEGEEESKVKTQGTGDMWDRYDQLYKKYQEGKKEVNELEKELARLKDQ